MPMPAGPVIHPRASAGKARALKSTSLSTIRLFTASTRRVGTRRHRGRRSPHGAADLAGLATSVLGLAQITRADGMIAQRTPRGPAPVRHTPPRSPPAPPAAPRSVGFYVGAQQAGAARGQGPAGRWSVGVRVGARRQACASWVVVSPSAVTSCGGGRPALTRSRWWIRRRRSPAVTTCGDDAQWCRAGSPSPDRPTGPREVRHYARRLSPRSSRTPGRRPMVGPSAVRRC